MITQAGKSNSLGSIKKAERATERKIIKELKRVTDSNGDFIPLIGRVAYCYCEGCEDNAPHKIYKDKIKCWQCQKVSLFSYRGDQTCKTILLMI